MQPEITRRDINLVNRELGLDADQAAIVEMLVLDYETAFNQGLETIRTQIEDARPQMTEEQQTRQREQFEQFGETMREMRERMRDARGDDGEIDPTLMEEMRNQQEAMREQMEQVRERSGIAQQEQAFEEMTERLASQWRAERQALGAMFMQNLQTILTPDQLDRFPAFERALVREKTIPRGELSGESVNLFHLIRDMNLSTEYQRVIDPLLLGYGIELHNALVARNQLLDDETQNTFDLLRNDEPQRALAIVRRETALRSTVRDINEQYVDVIAAELGDELGEQLRQAYMQRGYERVFRPTRGQRSFDAAQGFYSLTDEVRQAIDQLEEAYLAELNLKNQQLVGVTRREEPKERVERIERMVERFSGNGGGFFGRRGGDDRDDDPIRQTYEEREQLDERYRQQLESMLTPEQVAALPPMQEERRGRGQRVTREQRQTRDQVVEQFDTDGDGRVSDEELEALRRLLQQEDRRRGRGGDQRDG